MSVGSQELDRSALERKERDALVSIAEALGKKPPSRARKGDIVDLILQLAGVEGPSAPAGGSARSDADNDTDSGGGADKPRRTRRAKTEAPEADGSPTGDRAGAAPDADGRSDASQAGRDDRAVAPTGGDLTASSAGTGAPTNGVVDRADRVDRAVAPSGATAGASAEPSNRAGSDARQGRDGQGAGTGNDNGGRGGQRGSQADGRSNDDGSRADHADHADNREHAEADQGSADGRGSADGQDRSDGHDRSEGHDRGNQDRGAQNNQGRNKDNRGNQGQHNQDRANQDRANQNNQGRNKNQNSQNQNNQNRGNQNQGGGQQYDDAEPGNRRRRRRGRGGERDRPQVEEVFQGEPVDVEGLLDLRDEGYGFLRLKGYLAHKDDAYVSVKQVRQFGLRKGDTLKGAARPASRNEKNPALLRIDQVNGGDPEEMKKRPRFEDLTPLFPDERLTMESPADPTNMTARIIDLVCPIGKGQRGLIVSPPKAGKTTVMKQIAHSIELNSPEVHLMVLLVDERPEEVTDFRRSLAKGEVIASTFDRPSDEHTQVAELAIERAKRRVEDGQDVVIMLDGITRLSRAYNLAAPATGRIMSGGIDTGALYPPKKFFGAARNLEEGGSLTILATALVETGSKMDEVIFEEFKGTGNMELRLDRRLAERRIYPAIDVDASSTRHEELLFERKQLQQAWRLRRVLSGLASDGGSAAAGLEMLIDRLKTFKTNDEFLAEVAKAPAAGV